MEPTNINQKASVGWVNETHHFLMPVGLVGFAIALPTLRLLVRLRAKYKVTPLAKATDALV